MRIAGSVVLITGANRGIGLHFAEAALARGAAKVYGAVRDPNRMQLAGVEPLKLDVGSAADVTRAAGIARDVNLVVNNAGILRPRSLLAPQASENLREHLETNLYGVLRMMVAFSPLLAINGGGAFLNVLSAASWINSGSINAYAVSKSAAWSLTNGMRQELRHQNTQVLAMHMGFVDTAMTEGMDVPKVSARGVVARAFDALEAGASEVIADNRAERVKAGLTATPPLYL